MYHRTYKLFICSLLFIMILLLVSSSYALSDFMEDGKAFLQSGDDIDDTIGVPALQETSNTIYNTLLAIAIMVAIVVAMVLGIQFIVASADEKAKVKEALMPYVIGCFIVFGSFTIWKIVVNIGNKAEQNIVTGYDKIVEVPEKYEDIQALSSSKLKEYHSYFCSIEEYDDVRFGYICYELMVNRGIYVSRWSYSYYAETIANFYINIAGTYDGSTIYLFFSSLDYIQFTFSAFFVYDEIYALAEEDWGWSESNIGKIAMMYDGVWKAIQYLYSRNGEYIYYYPPFSYEYVDYLELPDLK